MLRLSPAATPSGRWALHPTPNRRPAILARASWRPSSEENGPSERALLESRSVFATFPPSGDATLFDARCEEEGERRDGNGGVFLGVWRGECAGFTVALWAEEAFVLPGRLLRAVRTENARPPRAVPEPGLSTRDRACRAARPGPWQS